MNINLDFTTILSLCSLAATVFVAYTTAQTKLEIAKLKVWIYQNFEPKNNNTVIEHRVSE